MKVCRWAAGLVLGLVPLLGQDFSAGLKAYSNKDYTEAARQWQPLAEGGDAAAQFNLGLLYLDGHGVVQNTDEAIEWFRRAANQGYARAQYNLGQIYASGQGVRKNLVVAHMWLNICAASGDSRCAGLREQVAEKMKKRDIADAQRRALEFKPVPEQVKR